MKKFILSAALLFVGLATVSAQDTFGKNSSVLGVGLGLGSTYYGSGYRTTIPPISVNYDYGVAGNLIDGNASIGVGAYLGFSAAKFNEIGVSNILIGARGTFHYKFVDNLDTYAGLCLGYNIYNWNSSAVGGTVLDGSSLTLGGFIGARYYFTPSFAVMAELGYGVSLLTVGVSFKL